MSDYTEPDQRSISYGELALLSGFESEILDLIDNKDNITTSDLQGMVECVIRKAYEAGKDNA